MHRDYLLMQERERQAISNEANLLSKNEHHKRQESTLAHELQNMGKICDEREELWINKTKELEHTN